MGTICVMCGQSVVDHDQAKCDLECKSIFESMERMKGFVPVSAEDKPDETA